MKKRLAGRAADVGLLAFAVVAAIASFAGEPADAYDFPRLSAVLMLLFAAANLALNRAKENALTIPVLKKIAPGVAVMIALVLSAEQVGFYWASFAAFWALSALYGGAKKRFLPLGVSCAVVLVLYLLFGVVLRVQTPDAFWVD